jgi:Tetracyclin repressor-like, C-terminal domain
MIIINSASSSSHFAKIYEQKYLQPRRKAFGSLIERAKTRKEVKANIDPNLVFDTISGIMLYAQIFPPARESWSEYIHRALKLMFQGVSS